jgi:hypothetical protein
MSSMKFSARPDIFFRRLLHVVKDAGVVACGLTYIHNVMVKCLFIDNRSCIHKRFLGVQTGKNADDLNLASMEAMQWVVFCLFIGHDRHY